VPYENLSQLLNDSFKIYSIAEFIDTRKVTFKYRFYFDGDEWDYLQSQNYSQFLKINVLDSETPLKDIQYTKLENTDEFAELFNYSYFPFGPLVSGLNNGIFYISEISLFFTNVLGGEEAGISFFAETKHLYNYTSGATKRLLETVKLVPKLDGVMSEFLKEKFPNETAIQNTEFFRDEDKSDREWFSFIDEAKSFLKKRQNEIYINLLDECNNTAIYLPRVTANQVARQIQRQFKQLAYIGTEKLYKKDLLIDFLGHIPPFVFDTVKSFKESGVMSHIFDFISSTSKPPPTENTLPSKPTMEGNIAVVFIILLAGFGMSTLVFCGENYKALYKWMVSLAVIIWQAIVNVTYLTRESKKRTKVHPFVPIED